MIRNLCIQLLFLFAAFPVASFAQANAVSVASHETTNGSQPPSVGETV